MENGCKINDDYNDTNSNNAGDINNNIDENGTINADVDNNTGIDNKRIII